jgi:hypothetical protein
VLRIRRFGDGEQARATRQKGECHLARRRAQALGHLAERCAARAARRKLAMLSVRRVADDRHVVRLAPRENGVLDTALFQVIEHLIAGDATRAGDLERPLQLVFVEVTHAPSARLARLHQLLERRDRVL